MLPSAFMWCTLDKTASLKILILHYAHLRQKMITLSWIVFQWLNLVFVSTAYRKTLKQWLLHTSLQSSWELFKRSDWKLSYLLIPSWQWKENTSANDSHLFLPKTTVMGMLLQPHTPGAKTLKQLHQKQNRFKRESCGYREDLEAIYAE